GTGLDLSTFNFNNKIFVFNPTATGIGEWTEASVTIYPNPFNSHVHLQGENIPAEIKITDVTGKSMGFYPVINNTVNAGNLPSGVYFMEYNNTVVKAVRE
ncbi:MAG TPA: T9SS type A sorting domain-containing protein, partial [Bacteroidia bacterium]|nr:T9SS type A sorting domain-containing protein [Bacteroidia bacterium]